jgi:hypothetical protein
MIDYKELDRCAKKGKAELEKRLRELKEEQELLEKECRVTNEDLNREFVI